MNGIYISFNNQNIKSIWPSEDKHIKTKSLNPIPSGQRAFEFLFRPIFDNLEPLYWLALSFVSTPLNELLFTENGEEKLEELMEAYLDSAILFRPSTLPCFAHYVCSDWIDLIGIPQTNDVSDLARDFIERSSSPIKASYYDLIKSQSKICFFCVDGFSWELYSKDETLISKVVKNIENVSGFYLKHSSLEKRDSQLFDL